MYSKKIWNWYISSIKIKNFHTPNNIVLVQTKVKLGKDSYRMARVVETHPDQAGLVWRVTLEARPRGGPLGLPYKSKKLEKFEMAVQGLVLIHPRELEIPMIKDIDPVTNTKTLPEDNKKAQNDEVDRIIEIEDDVSDDKTLQDNKPEDMDDSYHNNCR